MGAEGGCLWRRGASCACGPRTVDNLFHHRSPETLASNVKKEVLKLSAEKWTRERPRVLEGGWVEAG
eukprot:CAMPEP_0197604124 /NCGR_PEP_ID=MMETSP1326-20131121/40582_1 /TAXON_ID=1155430 /ORGANISM="Genus nov. species nov., Strain RCC2288" /LENGTH=66 /DNA_ID=CAMNT_0043171737 /DNA_START=1 /DNA_END=197 /DNA_ORIENTATION=-